MAIVKTLWEGLGKTPQARVRNLILLLLTAGAIVAVTLNMRFGYNNPTDVDRRCKCKGFWIEWGPAADINIDIKKVSASGGGTQ